jgi:hypothetical protein
MTTPELEQVLAATFRNHAEDAMTNTDTRTEHERLEERLAEEAPRRRRRVVAGALVASAATVAAALWAADLGGGGPRTDPAKDADQQTAAERVADEFFAAYAAGDADLTASYLDRSEVPWSDLRHQLQTDRAWHMAYLPEPCQELSASAAGTNVVCPFDYHAYRSEELALGPFGKNSVELRIADGKVVYGAFNVNYQNNGELQLYRAIGAWVRENHPGDWAAMDDDEARTGAELARWHALWDQRLDEYVAEQLDGE